MKPKSDAKPASGPSASAAIDAKIAQLGDWRGRTLARVRSLVRQADPEVVEELKWRGVPVWSHSGILCTGEVYKSVVKMTFANGAALPDPSRLFNSSLEGNTRRAIDLHEDDRLDENALTALIRAAVAFNEARGGKRRPASAAPAVATKQGARRAPAKLLSGGNPQIAKGDGDAPVQAYIDAMPGWKSDVGRRLDAIVTRAVPRVRKAVKWNSPFYGVDGRSFFLNFHCFTKYVKVAFFRGTSLRPMPPGESRQGEVRYLDIREGDAIDEKQLASWVRQASKLPGWTP